MKYKEFKENLQKQIQSEYTEADIYTEIVGRNNGISKERLVIRDKGEHIVPCIYLRELYQCYEETGDMKLCVQMVKQLAERRKEMPVCNIPKIWEECRGRILLRLVCREWNRGYLETVPYKEFLNLAVTFHLLLEKTEDAVYSMPVTNEIMAIWGTSEDELFQAGMEHLHEHSHFEVSGIDKFISQFMGEEPGADIKKEKTDLEERKKLYQFLLHHMYVLSAVPYCFGSIGMLATQELKAFADQAGGFYILPSSVHELIIFPEFIGVSVDYLKSIVQRINQSDLLPEERLSDSVYYFNPESGEVELVGN